MNTGILKRYKMLHKDEIWKLEFGKTSMSIFLNGNKVLEEAVIVARDEKRRYVAAGNVVLRDEKNYAETSTPMIYGSVNDFEGSVYYLKTVFRDRLNRRNRVQSITVIIPVELGVLEERAIREALAEISKEVHLEYKLD